MPLVKTIWCCLIGLMLCGIGPLAVANTGNRLYSVDYKDSIRFEDGGKILSAPFAIRNEFRSNVSMGVSISYPKSWRVIGNVDRSKLASFFLKPDEKKVIPITMLHSNSIKAGWDSIRIHIWSYYKSDSAVYWIRFYVPEKHNFSVVGQNLEQNFTRTNPGEIQLKLQVKNSGNTDEVFRLSASSALLKLDYNVPITVPSGRDTAINLSINTAQVPWREFQAENLSVSVRSTTSDVSKTCYFKLRKVGERIELPLAARRSIPLMFGGGMMMSGDDIRYYGQFGMQLKFGKHYLSFNYRSQEFGAVASSYQPNAFSFAYSYKKFSVQAGQILGPKNFFTFGQGVQLRYRSANTELSISALRHTKPTTEYVNRSFENDNIYSNLTYRIKRMKVNHQLESNFNSYYGINSYLVHNEVEVFKTNASYLRFYGGAGYEQKTRRKDLDSELKIGLALGYDFRKQFNNWIISSTIRYRSSAYPGIYQGQQYQSHQITRNFGKYFITGTVFQNKVERNFLRDTLYNTDFLSTNSTKFGGGLGMQTSSFRGSVIAGKLIQAGRQYSFDGGTYIDLLANYAMSKTSSLQLIANNAIVGRGANWNLSTNSQLQFATKYFGISGYYNRIPVSYDRTTVMTESIYGGPFVNAYLFKNTLSITLRYNAAKTMSEASLRHGVGGQLNLYTENGLTLGANGFFPMKDPTRMDLPLTETRNLSVFLTKRINIPLERRKVFTASVTLFKDDNNNNTYDKGEPLLNDAYVNINDNILVTHEAGRVECRNLRPGLVRIMLNNAKVGSLIPFNGITQSFDLTEDKEIFIPFREGRKLNGNLKVINDSLSVVSITPDNFKIVIRDSIGTTYYALTNPAGDFYAYLPDGKYTVALNAEAFEGSAYTPERMSFQVILNDSKTPFVQFKIVQKKRKIRMLKAN